MDSRSVGRSEAKTAGTLLRSAPWRSGYAAACKAVYTGSIPVGASAVSETIASRSRFTISPPGYRVDSFSGKDSTDGCSPNIVLVHGAWADGSCWSDVIERLQADGYKVTAPQLPETSLADDVARVRLVLSRQSGPTVLGGHSYGGQVITSLGTDAPNVVGLVYIAAFGLDEGESIGGAAAGGPPPPGVAKSTSTRRAPAGSQRTISSVISPPTSTRSRRRSCTPCSSR